MNEAVWRAAAEGALAVCWCAFGLAWLAGAAYNAWKGPRTRTRSLGSYVWVIVVVLVWLADRRLGDHVHGMHVAWGRVDAWWIDALGLVALIASTAFTLWTRCVLGTMWSSAAVVKDNHVLRTDGPYTIVRHPIYTGLLGMLLGTALISGLGVWIPLFAVAVVLFESKIYFEERLLRRSFGDDYDAYRTRVPQLVPGLRLRSR